MTQLGRPREFDVDKALEQIMDVFWAKGYEAASIADIIEATGLQKGSLYKAFGDKRSLFLQALDRYLDRGLTTMREAAKNATDAGTALEHAVAAQAFALCKPRNKRRGCLAFNSVVELAPHDREIAERLRAHFLRQRQIIRPVIERAQKEGQIRTDESAEDLTEMLIMLLPAVVAASKLGGGPDDGRRVMDLAMRLMKP